MTNMKPPYEDTTRLRFGSRIGCRCGDILILSGLMRAYVLKHYGGPEGSLLMDVPAPVLRPRDILVEVRAAGLNPVDFKFRQGKLRAILRPKLPFVLGNEFAGEVIGVGDDVKQFRVGDRVFARVAKERAGAFAEQACVDEDHVAHMPRDLDFTAAA